MCVYNQMKLILYEAMHISNKKCCQLNQECDIKGAVRLVGGASELEGQVEECTPNMTWTPVCSEDFSDETCKMLGYSRFSKLMHSAITHHLHHLHHHIPPPYTTPPLPPPYTTTIYNTTTATTATTSYIPPPPPLPPPPQPALQCCNKILPI